MKDLNISGGYDEYESYLENNPEEWEILDSFCYVTISKFFRDRKLWDNIRDEILSEYLLEQDRKHPMKIWSAGCCNWEEPYSIAIIADQLLGRTPDAKNLKILASDREKAGSDGLHPVIR